MTFAEMMKAPSVIIVPDETAAIQTTVKKYPELKLVNHNTTPNYVRRRYIFASHIA
jgi:hypothetical protein